MLKKEGKREQLCANRTYKHVDEERMNRSIKDMLNLSDHITSPSHTHAMFDKTNLFS